MLQHLQPGRPAVALQFPVHGRLAGLVEAANRGEPLEPEVLKVVQDLGYESFMYGMCTSDARPQHDSRAYVWTTLPREWVAFYDRKAYVEVDPRLTHTWNRTAPFLWDADSLKEDWKAQAFLDDAARFGVCSGAVVSFRDNDHARIIVALNSSINPVTQERRAMLMTSLGDVLLLAMCFHDLFMSCYVDQGVPPSHQGSSLSPRELECLTLAARGMTSSDIGIKLGITERTANFHFSNIISKLGVVNRHEAIAIAVATGIIRARTSG
jgi:DNA-binding CsgD family transcriptional regulator